MIGRASSIRWRLALWYGASVLLVFLAGGLVLRGAVRRTLLAEFDNDALDSSQLVKHFFHVEAAEYPTVQQAVTDLVAEIVFADRKIEFIRPDGRVLTPAGTAADANVRLAPPLRTLTVALDSSRAPGWSMRIISSAADLEQTLRAVDGWFLIGAPFIAGLAVILGWTLAGRLLRPVESMALAAGRITAAEPSGRLPVLNPNDEIGRLGGSFNDLLQRLEGALGQQRRFLADAAHELRTPIARMASLTELTLAPAGHAVNPTETLGLIGADLQRAGRLVDELLQLARADAGERMQRTERVFLDDLVMDALAAWRALADRGGLELRLGDVEESPIRVDPLLARRLLDILIENAVRYTPRGGRIVLDVRQEADQCVLAIADSGIGIAADEAPRIFERFFRGTAQRALAPEGSGLGLPIAAWIVDQCGGTIELVPSSLGGTSAVVVLPLDTVDVSVRRNAVPSFVT